MNFTSRGILDPVDDDKQSPFFAQLRPKGQFAPKVWKNCKKMQNTLIRFEPVLIRLADSALDHLATLFYLTVKAIWSGFILRPYLRCLIN